MELPVSEKVLVVDDDPLVLDFVTDLLNRERYVTIPFASATDAAASLKGIHFDIVLTDIVMPGDSGITLIEKVHAKDPEIPVILMSAYATLDKAIEAIKKGAFDFIIKPSKSEQILHAVARAFKYRHLIQIEKDYKLILEEFNQEIEFLVAERTKSFMAVGLAQKAMASVSAIERACRRLMETEGGSEAAERMMKSLEEQGRQLRAIVMDFKVVAPRRGVALRAEDLNAIVDDVVSLTAEEASAKGVNISLTLSDLPISIMAQKNLLRVAVSHVIRNAVRATPAGGKIEVLTELGIKEGLIMISDNGPGMPRHALKRLFDPLYFPQRLETGMAMPLVKAIVVEHQGRIKAESTIGIGTVLRISFPLFV